MSKQTSTDKGEKIVSVLLEKGEYNKLTFLTLASIGANILGGLIVPIAICLIIFDLSAFFAGLTLLNIITIGVLYIATFFLCVAYIVYVNEYVEYLENGKKS